MKLDSVVVGGGLAGLVAAIRVAERGRRVCLVAEGQGMLPLFAGPLAVWGAGTGIDAMAAALSPGHPYRVLGAAALRAALAFFRDLTRRAGLPYVGDAEANGWVPTPLGRRYPCRLLPERMAPPQGPAVLVQLPGFLDGVARRVRAALTGAEPVVELEADRGSQVGTGWDSDRWARFLDTAPGARWILERLGDRLPPGDTLLLPAVLGVEGHEALGRALEAASGRQVREWMGWPPSPPGARLRRALVGEAARLGVDLRWGVRATLSGGPHGIEGVTVVPKPAEGTRGVELRPETVVLATGGLPGGGLVVERDGSLLDRTLGRGLAGAGSRLRLFGETPFAAAPAFAAGYPIDGRARPVDASGRPLYPNLFAAGRAVGGYDGDREASGGGVALVTAFVAGGEA